MRKLLTLTLATLSIHLFANDTKEEELIISTPQERAIISERESSLIRGVVSPLGGSPVLWETDLVVKGAQPISLDRLYIPPQIPHPLHEKKRHKEDWNKYTLYWLLRETYKGWQFFPHLQLQIFYENNFVRVGDKNGMTLDFQVEGGRTKLLSNIYGISNASGEKSGGQYDPRNTQLELNGNKVIVTSPQGIKRIYECKGEGNPHKKFHSYYLQKETLPNGKELHYIYEKRQLKEIKSMSRNGEHTYASLEVEGNPSFGSYKFISSNNLEASYEYEKRRTEVEVEGDIEKEHYCRKVHLPFSSILTQVSSPKFRNEQYNYSDLFHLNYANSKEKFFKAKYRPTKSAESSQYRLQTLLLPVGKANAFESVCTIDYNPPIPGVKEGATTVNYIDGTKTIYRYGKNLLAQSIDHFNEKGELALQKRYRWTQNHHLESIETVGEEKQLIHKKTFEYDRFGNPTIEKFTGNLSGTGEIETYTIKREFSEDGLHLLLREETEEGKIVTYKYLPGTNLPLARHVQAGCEMISHSYWNYDENNNLIEKIEEDELQTERRVTRYILKNSPPFLHMPEEIQETYFEEGAEKLLQKRRFTYDKWGNIAEEEVYDSNDQLAYIIYRTYNERGDLLSETNPIGQKATYTYDEKGRLIHETSFSGRQEKSQTYDSRGRLTQQKQIGDDQITQTITNAYDKSDHLIQKIDPYDNRTTYEYDPLTHKAKATHHPEILTEEGEELTPTTRATYDSLGRKTSQIDANGNKTYYTYNARGAVATITHPNNSKETYIYYRNGNLKSHTNQDGLTTTHTYDLLGRLLSKSYANLATETYTYNAYHLETETNKLGFKTTYIYDGQGRKTAETFCDKTTEYTYDPLGRVQTTTYYNKENTLCVHFSYDLLDRLTETIKTDTSGKLLYQISYGYDQDGNRSEITRYIHNIPSTTTYTYDSLGRETQSKDPLGAVTITAYNPNQLNFLGQKTLQVKKTNPNHITKVKTYDPFGNLACLETLDTSHQTIAKKDYIYDPCHNLSLEKDHIYKANTYQSTQQIHYTYNPLNKVETLTRGYKGENEKTTVYSYTPSGKLQTKTTPDQITLTYTYSSLGYKETTTSSDKTIDHHFERDFLGRLTKAQDKNQNTTITRTLDPYGNILKETFPNNLTIEKTYDLFDRPLTTQIADHGQITYTYSPLHMKTTTWKGRTHAYTEYDLDGNPTQETLYGNAGPLFHKRDSKGRVESTFAPSFQQTLVYDPCDNLLSISENKQIQTYAYDPLDQLIKERKPTSKADYTYDSNYNRLEKNQNPRHYNDLNELTNCEYDERGNLTAKDTLQLTYDPLNRLIEAQDQDTNITYTYDPLGRRLTKTTPSQTEHYLWDNFEEIATYTDKIDHVKILGRNSQTPVAIELNATPYATILDLQGSIRQLLDPQTHTPIATYQFTAFGEQISATSTPYNPWRFAGKRVDPELNLIYYGKRYYDPDLARWLTTDPAGFHDATNLYQFLLNNPFKYYDPDGEFAQAIIIPLVIFGAGAAPTLAAVGTSLAISAAAYGAYRGVEYMVNSGTGSAALNIATGFVAEAAYGLNSWIQRGGYPGGPLDVGSYYRPLPHSLSKRSSHGDPDPLAEGNPHTTIEESGPDGGYTTFNEDGTVKQYRGSGKPHGNIPRPNVKENYINESPSGPRPGKPQVREPRAEEIPK